jgi:hypothetical protein
MMGKLFGSHPGTLLERSGMVEAFEIHMVKTMPLKYWIFPFKMLIFHSYVSLPEGTYLSHIFPYVSHILPHMFPIFPYIYPYVSYIFHSFPRIFPFIPFQIAMAFPGLRVAAPKVWVVNERGSIGSASGASAPNTNERR